MSRKKMSLKRAKEVVAYLFSNKEYQKAMNIVFSQKRFKGKK